MSRTLPRLNRVRPESVSSAMVEPLLDGDHRWPMGTCDGTDSKSIQTILHNRCQLIRAEESAFSSFDTNAQRQQHRNKSKTNITLRRGYQRVFWRRAKTPQLERCGRG